MVPPAERQTGSNVHVPVFVGVIPHFCRDQCCQKLPTLNMLKRILHQVTTIMQFPIIGHSLWGPTFSHTGLE
jgi:hypothetical protein